VPHGHVELAARGSCSDFLRSLPRRHLVRCRGLEQSIAVPRLQPRHLERCGGRHLTRGLRALPSWHVEFSAGGQQSLCLPFLPCWTMERSGRCRYSQRVHEVPGRKSVPCCGGHFSKHLPVVPKGNVESKCCLPVSRPVLGLHARDVQRAGECFLAEFVHEMPSGYMEWKAFCTVP